MTRHIGISVPHRRMDDDDDIQDYKKPWVGLTDEETAELVHRYAFYELTRQIETKLKEKNGG